MDNIKLNLLQGKYNEVEKECSLMNAYEIRDVIMNIAYDTESLFVYGFVCYMIEKTKAIIWIELAIDILLNPLCFIEGAYSVALFHARDLLITEKSVKNLERIIFFYNMPEKLVDEVEAKKIAIEILRLEPDNIVANALLKY